MFAHGDWVSRGSASPEFPSPGLGVVSVRPRLDLSEYQSAARESVAIAWQVAIQSTLAKTRISLPPTHEVDLIVSILTYRTRLHDPGRLMV